MGAPRRAAPQAAINAHMSVQPFPLCGFGAVLRDGPQRGHTSIVNRFGESTCW